MSGPSAPSHIGPKMGTRLEGRSVIVTGAASAPGRAAARVFAGEGARLVLADADAAGLARAAELARSAGAEVRSYAGDLAREAGNEEMVALALEAHGRLDALYTLAGQARFGPADRFTLEDWEFGLGHELTMTFLACKHALRAMLAGEGGGSIVNMASISGLVGVPGHASHAAAKMGIIGLSRQIAVEYGPRGIRCNAIAPGPIDTRPGDGRDERPGPARLRATPEDTAWAALFLASDESAAITGQVLRIDGGASIR